MFTKEALQYVLTQSKLCNPILCYEEYVKILHVLEQQPQPIAWNYVTFFKELFPNYT